MTTQAEHSSEETEIRDASPSLTEIAEALGENPESVVYAEIDGEPPLAVMAWDYYEALVDTLEILSDPEAREALRLASVRIATGERRPVEDVAAELGL